MSYDLSISVIIPIYNCDRYLAEAIQSVLDQTYPVHEIIVVDDGSTDESIAIARQFPQVKVLTQTHQGAAAARNLGIRVATGEFIAFLDADDVWLPDKLARQLQVFITDPTMDLVFTYVQQFISPELDEMLQSQRLCPEESMMGQMPTTAVMRRSCFQRIGEFNTQLTIGEFIDWVARGQEVGILSSTLPETLARRRIHTSNTGIRLRDSRQDYVKLVKAALDRRRTLTYQTSPSECS
jgi:glycosyltransferase involved in cell wall biosynthesis